MKRILLLFFLLCLLYYSVPAQQVNDSLLMQLNLTKEQKLVFKSLISEYRLEEKKRRAALRLKMYGCLTPEQKNIIRERRLLRLKNKNKHMAL